MTFSFPELVLSVSEGLLLSDHVVLIKDSV